MISFVTAVLLLAATPAPAPKNVILLVADGAGPAHFTFAAHLRGTEFRIGTMPVLGLHTTGSADRPVTDSAAASTAFATGKKVNYGALGLDPATGAELPTVLEMAEAKGMATGLVTTAPFWDATAAAFAAHIDDRYKPGVREQMLSRGVEVIAGGGLEKFGKEGVPPLDAFAKSYGYAAASTRAELASVQGPRVLAVFPTDDRDGDFAEIRLPDLARWALDRVGDDPDGFFLLIEHEGTDTASHYNLSADVREGLISFDEAVGVALDFASKRDDTLVLVTADHETGGLRLTETRSGRLRMEWSTVEHTATAVPIFAYGPGSAAFAGLQENTDVGRKLIAIVSSKK